MVLLWHQHACCLSWVCKTLVRIDTADPSEVSILFINLVDGFTEHELHAAPEGQPTRHLRVLFHEVEIFRRVELHADTFGVGLLLDFRIDPGIGLHHEGAPAHKPRLDGWARDGLANLGAGEAVWLPR